MLGDPKASFRQGDRLPPSPAIERLFVMGEDGQPEQFLADDYEIAEDQTSLLLRWRKVFNFMTTLRLMPRLLIGTWKKKCGKSRAGTGRINWNNRWIRIKIKSFIFWWNVTKWFSRISWADDIAWILWGKWRGLGISQSGRYRSISVCRLDSGRKNCIWTLW